MTEMVRGNGAAPITSQDRLGELDVLRGFALLGVLIANFVWFAFSENTATEAQTQGFIADNTNLAVIIFVEIFVSDKANTLFAFLFGLGFWVQMERLSVRGAAFGAIYTRRLLVLLVFGWINLWLIWPWDILNLYALTGFLLFLLRGLPARAMLALGVVLAVAGRPVMEGLSKALGIYEPASEMAFSAEAVAARQDAFINGSYVDWVEAAARLTWYDWFANGLILAWVLYALGRFLIGAYVARRGWIQRSAELLPKIRTIFRIALPLGLALEILAMLTGDSEMLVVPGWVHEAVHMVGVPVLDIGYATGLILLFHSPRWAGLAKIFGPVGRMALTNYLVQGVFIGFFLYSFHGGLGLSGQIQPKQTLPLCLGFFALQTVFSHWWLGRFRFGPMEWLWRALTYGKRPQMRPQPA